VFGEVHDIVRGEEGQKRAENSSLRMECKSRVRLLERKDPCRTDPCKGRENYNSSRKETLGKNKLHKPAATKKD